MTTHGGRFVGGYQFPSTSAATLRRGEPLLHEDQLGGPWRAVVELVPMTGGRPDLFDVSMTWNHSGTRQTGAITCLVQGEGRAREAFRRTIAHLAARGAPPESIPVPPDTPIF